MSNNNMYDALIKYDGGQDYIKVDMQKLPYDMFGPGFPLEIQGAHVDMGKGDKTPLPSMANVWIYGEFDCSEFTISDDTVLPDKISSLVCKHSLSDLGVLIGKLPETLRQIVVRPAVLNNIKKDAAKRENAMRLLQMYPYINVTDGKKTLNSIFEEIAPIKKTKLTVPAKTALPQTEIEYQPDDWYSIDDLTVICEKRLTSDMVASLTKPLDRYTKQALSAKSKLNLETREFKRRADDAIIKCVPADAVEAIIDFVFDAISADATRAQQKSKAKAKTIKEKKTDAPKTSASVRPTYYVGNTQIAKTKIKKYISKSAWGQIQSAAGKGADVLLNILQDIQDINVNPAILGDVVFIKDNQVQKSTNVEFKSANCIAQRFDKKNNRPRIVWGIDGNTFVCQDFFATHEGKEGLKYNQTIRNMNVDVSKLDLENDFYLVATLIEDLTKSNEAPMCSPEIPSLEQIAPDVEISEDTETSDPTEQTVISQQTADVPETVKPVAKQLNAQDVSSRRRRQRIKAAPVFTTKKPNQTNKSAQQKRLYTPPVIDMTQPVSEWASLYEIHGQFIEIYNMLESQQHALLQQMSAQTNTEQLIDATKQLQEVLEKKQKIEAALAHVEKTNRELLDLVAQTKANMI